MSGKPKNRPFKDIQKLVQYIRNDLDSGKQDFVLLFAYNGTGKTRVSMAFKESGKKSRKGEVANAEEKRDTLYFNAFTEDLFIWDNDLEGDSDRVLKINSSSQFFNGFKELALEEKIFLYLERYVKFDFKIDYDNWEIRFSCTDRGENVDNIKVSRGEQNIFVWCVFLAIVQLALENAGAYSWVKYVYIDDPISSLDDNNTIAVASDLAHLLIQGKGRIKTVISSHHALFFNVICNELRKQSLKRYFLYRNDGNNQYILQTTDDTPFFHHVATLSELHQAMSDGKLYTYHFNVLRSIMERTATFFGFKEFSSCLHGLDDEMLYARALNLLSHSKYSLYEPREMVQDSKDLFKSILNAFMEKYRFDLPELLAEESGPSLAAPIVPTLPASVTSASAEQPT